MENLKMGTPEVLSQITELKIPEEQLEKDKKHSLRCSLVSLFIAAVIGMSVGVGVSLLLLKQIEITYILLVIIALPSFATILAYKEYQIREQKIVYKIEEAKALSALKRKLIEDIITRDIKIKEKVITLEIETAEKEKYKIKIKDKLEQLKWLLSLNKTSNGEEDKNDTTEKFIKEIEKLEELFKTF
ncbi:MAG: hypothetical protein IJZ11_08325 [Bacteroidaceae bacterium]|nr:hypothetical protein [Bacteroidaceae bacterium]